MTGARALALAGLVLAGLPGAAEAFSAGDPARGRAFALERCAGCHQVPGGRETLVAPSFLAIAADSETYGAEALADAVRKPHWGQRRVSRGDGADVIAFIASLRAELATQGESGETP